MDFVEVMRQHTFKCSQKIQRKTWQWSKRSETLTTGESDLGHFLYHCSFSVNFNIKTKQKHQESSLKIKLKL